MHSPSRHEYIFTQPLVYEQVWNVTPSPPTTLSQSSNHVTSYAGRWSTSGWGGNAHFFTYTRIRSRETGENRKTNEQTKLGVTKGRGRCCNTICMCRLSLAWVTSENSTMLLGSDILRLFFTGPYLVSSPLCSVSGVDCPSVDPRQLPLLLSNYQLPLSGPCLSLGVWCWLPLRGLQPQLALCWSPATNSALSCHQLSSLLSNYQLSLLVSCHQLPTASLWSLPLSGSRRQLSFASPYHFMVWRDFMSKNPLSGFAPKQTIESSALAAYPHSATQDATQDQFFSWV